MFTVSILHLILIIGGSAFVGTVIGFFAAALLAANGQGDEEERRQWPGSIDR